MNKSVYEKMFSKTPDIVNVRIEQEVNKQINDENVVKPHFHAGMRKTAAAACIAVCVIGTTAFASDKIYNTYLKRDGYEVTIYHNYETGIKSEDEINSETQITTEQIRNKFDGSKYIAVDTAYLPEGCEYIPKDGKYDGLTMDIRKISGRAEIATVKDVISTQEYHYDGKTGYILTKNGGAYDKECYLIFDNCDYILHIYVRNDISMDETEKILEGCSFYGTDEDDIETKAVARSFEWLDKRLELEINGDPDFPPVVAADNDVDVSNAGGVGSTVMIDGYNYIASYTLNAYQLADSLNDIKYDESYFGSQFKSNEETLLNPDKTLKTIHYKTIRNGDGKSSLREVMAERDADMAFLVLDLTMDVKVIDKTRQQTISISTSPYLATTHKNQKGCYDIWDNLFEMKYAIYNDFTGDESYINVDSNMKRDYKVIYVVEKERADELYVRFGNSGSISVNDVINIK